MLLKEEIRGVRCEFSENQSHVMHDEFAVVINGREVIVKKKHVELENNAEKLAAMGESPIFLKKSGVMHIIGPTKFREYRLRMNSRGYAHEFFVPEASVLFGK